MVVLVLDVDWELYVAMCSQTKLLHFMSIYSCIRLLSMELKKMRKCPIGAENRAFAKVVMKNEK